MLINFFSLGLLVPLVLGNVIPLNQGDADQTLDMLDKRGRGQMEDRITSTGIVGNAKRGKPFDERALIGTDHKRMTWIEFSGCEKGEHINWIHTGYGHNGVATEGGEHGLDSDTAKSIHKSLDGDRIIKVELTTWKKKVGTTYKTRLGWIRLTTKQGKTIECGAKKPKDTITTWYTYGKSLLYLSGTSGDAIDSLQGHFIPSEDY